MRLDSRRIVIFLLILAISVGFGFAFDGIVTAVERHNHPIDARYTAEIQKNAAEFGVPEAILWATVCEESGFVSSLVSDTGEIGLMQLSADRFSYICTELLGEPARDTGMLYDPATNLRAGSAYLSALYRRYGVWETVFAAYAAGEAQVDAWLANPDYVSKQGRLQEIPDDEVADFVKDAAKSAELYQKLYFNK